MRATETLKDEHRVIEQVLNSLERIAEQGREKGILCIQDASDALDFFRDFADGCHHKKEEDQLFPLLEARGMPRQDGPTGVMRTEHEQGRELIRAMRRALDAAAAHCEGAVEQFANYADSYVKFLRAHIDKEDHCLFAMADSMLTSADQERLEAGFATIEHEQDYPHRHDRYLTIASELAKHYHVAGTGAAHAQATCRGTHRT